MTWMEFRQLMSLARRTVESFAVGSIDGGSFCARTLGSTEGSATAPVSCGSPYLHVSLFIAQSWDSKKIGKTSRRLYASYNFDIPDASGSYFCPMKKVVRGKVFRNS